MDDRRKEGFVCCRFPEDNSFHCNILERTVKSKKEKASKSEHQITHNRRG